MYLRARHATDAESRKRRSAPLPDRTYKWLTTAGKCDEIKPVCGRCTRLKLICVGSGERRYKFEIQVGGTKGAPVKVKNYPSSSPSATPEIEQRCVLMHPPSNTQSIFSARLVDIVMFDSNTDLRYSMSQLPDSLHSTTANRSQHGLGGVS